MADVSIQTFLASFCAVWFNIVFNINYFINLNYKSTRRNISGDLKTNIIFLPNHKVIFDVTLQSLNRQLIYIQGKMRIELPNLTCL